jgi:hypothetical protein
MPTKITDLYELAKRAAAGAPLVKGVRNRQEALANMDNKGRMAAEAKTRLRPISPSRGKAHGSLVNRYNNTVTGSTRKNRKFGK